jgi:predicted secreted protein
MSLVLTLAIFFVVWWIVFLGVLPFGVKTSTEAGEALVPGQAAGAPRQPLLIKKALWTTVIAILITFLAWCNAYFGWIEFADLPGPNKLY